MQINLKKVVAIITLLGSIGGILVLLLDQYAGYKIQGYQNEIGSLKSKVIQEENKKYFNIKNILIDKFEINNLKNTYTPLIENKELIFFNELFVNNNWDFRVLTLKELTEMYFKKFPSNIDKYKLNRVMYHWKSDDTLIASNSDQYESHISMSVESIEDINNYFKNKYPNISDRDLKYKTNFYFKNYIKAEISNNLKELIKLNTIDDNTEVFYEDNISYINHYVKNNEFIFFTKTIIIKVKNYIINIDAKIVTKNGISNHNEYFIKWLNNIKIIKD